MKLAYMENECEALPGVAYPGVRDNHSTLNTKTGYDDDDMLMTLAIKRMYNLPPHLSYVSTLPDITQKLKRDIDELKH